jgi:cell wall-associated NlpC family hydrolase
VDTAEPPDYYASVTRISVSLTVLTTLCALGPVTGSGLRAQEPEGMSSILPIPSKAEKPFAALSRALLGGRDSLVNLARQQVGLNYRLGAVSPGLAFDCSGLVKWVMQAFDIQLPRTAAQQARLGIEVPKDTARMLPGDLMFFGRGKRVTHIGIYVGEGKYVHAANRRKGVVESELARALPRWWKGVRRVLMAPDSGIGSKS